MVVGSLVLLIVGVVIGGHPSWLPSSLRGALTDENDGRLVHQALDVITHDYYRPLNRNQLVNTGLQAAVAGLRDPYSHYFDPTSYRAFLNQTNPHVNGIGINIVADAKGLRVIDVYPGSPAARAGLQRADVITNVGKTPLAGRTTAFAATLIQGRPGTTVVLTVWRAGHPWIVRITRAALVVPVTTGKVVTYHGTKIGVVNLTTFSDGSGDELRAQVDKVLHQGARAIVLDLRQNGGGLLNEAVNVASIFIPDGTIVSTDGRSQPRQVYTAKGGAIPGSIPVVVLVDQGTASASEIVTGALKDRGRAKVVGTHTYGKGVFQEIKQLSNGGALDITVGEYFTPSGHNLGGGGVREGAGIKPDVYALDNPHTQADEALNVALRAVDGQIR
ncbi:MAG: S41 family peptidase [Solirubrobacteraceae bacterium]